MNLIGYDFISDGSAFCIASDIPETYDYVKLERAKFDEIMASTDIQEYMQPMVDAWKNATIIHACFDGNLIAGNIIYKAEIISKMRVKRREVGTTQWLTLCEVPINKPEDFAFTFVDRFARKGDYEYCIVPMIGNNEQNYMVESVSSSFDGIIVCDYNESFQTIADASIPTISRTRPNAIVTTLENKYPYVVYNGSTNYESGSVSGVFVEIDWESKQFKLNNIPRYSTKVMNFLANGKPKILKTWDGRIWMVDITDAPSASVGSHPNQITVSFSFIEIGSVESSTDMYNNAFIDVNVEGS